MTLRPRCQSGLSAVEMITGGLVIVTICLALFDMGVLVLANTIHDAAVKNAARAAANQQTAQGAEAAARRALSSVASSPIVGGVTLEQIQFNRDGNGLVWVKTRMQVRLPVPVPGYETIPFEAAAAEPCVAIRR